MGFGLYMKERGWEAMEEGLLTLFAAFFVEEARAYLRRRSEDIELAFKGVGVARLYVEGGGWRGRVPTLIAYFAEGARARPDSSNSWLTRGQCALEDARESQRTPHASSPATLETPSPSFSHSMSPASRTLQWLMKERTYASSVTNLTAKSR